MENSIEKILGEENTVPMRKVIDITTKPSFICRVEDLKQRRAGKKSYFDELQKARAQKRTSILDMESCFEALQTAIARNIFWVK